MSAPQPGYPEPASAHLDAAAYGTGYAAGQQAVAAANWYGSVGPNHAVDGYLPAPRPGSAALTGDAGPGYGTARHAGYGPADYAIGYQAPAYQGGQAGPASGHGQPGQYDQGGYRGSDAAYGQDGYDAYPGYGGAAR